MVLTERRFIVSLEIIGSMQNLYGNDAVECAIFLLLAEAVARMPKTSTEKGKIFIKNGCAVMEDTVLAYGHTADNAHPDNI